MAFEVDKLVWSYTAEKILSNADKLIEQTTAIYDDIAAIPLADVNFDNVIQCIGNSDCEYAVTRYDIF